jgi:hypothetical protein
MLLVVLDGVAGVPVQYQEQFRTAAAGNHIKGGVSAPLETKCSSGTFVTSITGWTRDNRIDGLQLTCGTSSIELPVLGAGPNSSTVVARSDSGFTHVTTYVAPAAQNSQMEHQDNGKQLDIPTPYVAGLAVMDAQGDRVTWGCTSDPSLEAVELRCDQGESTAKILGVYGIAWAEPSAFSSMTTASLGLMCGAAAQCKQLMPGQMTFTQDLVLALIVILCGSCWGTCHLDAAAGCRASAPAVSLAPVGCDPPVQDMLGGMVVCQRCHSSDNKISWMEHSRR